MTSPVRFALGFLATVCLLLGLVEGAAANSITAENALPGDSHWASYKSLAPASAIQGYSSEVSVAPGETLKLHVNSPTSSYRIEVDRLGWYGGAGGRRMTCIPGCSESTGPVSQSNQPIVNKATGELDANWTVTNTVPIGSEWVSGYYLAVFMVTSGANAGKVAWYPFIVTPPPNDSSAIIVQVPTNTWQAYNPWPEGSTGKSLYEFNSANEEAAVKVSFNRPLIARPPGGLYYQEPVFGREIQTVRFLEREGYDVSYVTDSDVDQDPGLLLDHRVDMVLGHDEYWSASMRDGWETALDAGHNEVFMGADIGTWMVRYEDSNRTLVDYKYKHDPLSPPTVMFRDQDPPRPECELEGVQYDPEKEHPGTGDYTVASGAGANPWIRAAGLAPGDTIHAAVGYEWDGIPPGCATPTPETLFHFQGSESVANADAVTYTAPSGGRVFAAGSNMFSNMLDSYNDASSKGQVADPRIQAFTNALLAEFTKAPEMCTGSNITGAGSSLQKIAQTEVWGPAFQSTVCNSGTHPTITYNPTGSGSGLKEWNATGTKGSINTGLAFIGTDDAPSEAQIANVKSKAGGAEVAVIPVAQTSISILANPPAGCEVEGITNSNLAGVLEGRIREWSKLEGAEGTCNSPITRVVREDASGTTYQLKNYLDALYKKGLSCTKGATEGKASWAELEAIESPNLSWPESCSEKSLSALVRPAGAGGAEEVKKVNATAGSIGYAALPDAEANKTGTTAILALQNNGQKTGGAAEFAEPAAGATANCGGMAYQVPKLNGRRDIDWSGVYGAHPAIGASSYPLCTLTYDLAFHGYKAAGFTEGQEITARDYLYGYLVQSAGQKAIGGHYYSPLPSSSEERLDVLGAAQKAASSISW